jgi:NAD(P)-dependent dehydrogenase (short-subunit alcohol dehydrogenase family)
MNRTVVITGATSTTGRAAAQAFASHGDSVALLSRDAARLEALAGELELPAERVLTQSVDLRDAPALQAAAATVAAKFGAVHILIHLVGGWTGGRTLPETDPEDFKLMLRQHAHSTFNLFQAFVPRLIAAGWGRVLAISTPAASRATAKRGAYAAAKAAQEALFLTLAEELRGTGITANLIVVNAIDAERQGKGATPEEIVAAMLYLCSDEGGKVNGARLPLQ